MLSRVYDNDAKEEIKLINREKDDGNYIENAINFTKQQERQKNQIFINPNSTNETTTTNANTNPNSTIYNANTNANSTVQTNNFNETANNINETVDNTENFYTPMINQTANAVASTPRRGRSVSRISGSTLPLPSIEENLSEIDAEGNFICKMCHQQFLEENTLNQHILNDHNANINRFEHSSLSNKSLENLNIPRNLDSSDDVQMQTLDNTHQLQFSTPAPTSAFKNSGARPKSKTPIFGNRNNQNVLPSFKDFAQSPITKTSTPIQNTTKYRDSKKSPSSDIKVRPHLKSKIKNLTQPLQDDFETFNKPKKKKFITKKKITNA